MVDESLIISRRMTIKRKKRMDLLTKESKRDIISGNTHGEGVETTKAWLVDMVKGRFAHWQKDGSAAIDCVSVIGRVHGRVKKEGLLKLRKHSLIYGNFSLYYGSVP